MHDSLVHQMEPELLQPKPRRVTYRGRAWRGEGIVILGFVRLFLVPFLVVGILSLLSAFNGTLVALFGHTVPGQIIERYDLSDEDGDSWRVRYNYRVGERQYLGEDNDRSETELKPGDIVPVRFAPWLPAWGSKAMPPGASLWTDCAFRWFWTLAWNAILSPFVWLFFVGPSIYRSLFTRGDSAVGIIVDKSIQQGETATYILTYEFFPLSADLAKLSPRTNTEHVSEAEWRSVRIGDQVTVLYHLHMPRQSVIYRFGLYQIRCNGK